MEVRMTFNTDLAPASVLDLSHYSLKIHRAGRKGFTKSIGVSSTLYDAATRTIVMTLAKPQKVAMQMSLAGIASASGGVLAASFVDVLK